MLKNFNFLLTYLFNLGIIIFYFELFLFYISLEYKLPRTGIFFCFYVLYSLEPRTMPGT